MGDGVPKNHSHFRGCVRSVPKPLKFLRPHYATLKKVHAEGVAAPPSDVRRSLRQLERRDARRPKSARFSKSLSVVFLFFFESSISHVRVHT